MTMQPSCSMLDVPSHTVMGSGPGLAGGGGGRESGPSGARQHKTSVASFNLTLSTSPAGKSAHRDTRI